MSTSTEGIVHYDVTRVALIDALGNLPLGEHLHLEPRGRMADALLAQMPVASDAGFYMEGVKAERERIAELADAWDRESDEMRAESVRTGLHPALANGHREANMLRQRAAGLRSVLAGDPR